MKRMSARWIPLLAAALMAGCGAPEPEAPPATPTPEPQVDVYALAAPILPGQEEAFREMAAAITDGERAEAHRAAYAELGVTKEQVWLQETPEGSVAVVYLEGSDLEGLAAREAASEDPHVQWFLEQVTAVHGLDPQAPPPVNELVFRGDYAGVEGETEPYALAAPILEGEEAAFREFIAAFAERRAEAEASRSAKGIAKEYVWLQQTPEGSWAVVYFEATDPGSLLEKMMADSELQFDAWFKQHVADIHGLQPGGPASPNERIK
jgi:hypothetical protein